MGLAEGWGRIHGSGRCGKRAERRPGALIRLGRKMAQTGAGFQPMSADDGQLLSHIGGAGGLAGTRTGPSALGLHDSRKDAE